jgi:hypothetical protein
MPREETPPAHTRDSQATRLEELRQAIDAQQ